MGDRRSSYRIFEHKVPADDPGEQFAESRVSVGISRSGDGDHRGELSVTKRGENAGYTGRDH